MQRVEVRDGVDYGGSTDTHTHTPARHTAHLVELACQNRETIGVSFVQIRQDAKEAVDAKPRVEQELYT